MPNMSYYRFRNTLSDLYDCYNNLYKYSELSNEEKSAADSMYKLCQKFINEYEMESAEDEDIEDEIEYSED